MEVDSFKDMYLAELQEARSLEQQLTKALPQMVDAARDADLKEILKSHISETRAHLDLVDSILRRHGAQSETHNDQSMRG